MFSSKSAVVLASALTFLQPQEDLLAQENLPLPPLVLTPPNLLLAKTRVESMRQEIESMGMIVGPVVTSNNPLLINGEPAIAILVADEHTKRIEDLNKEQIERLREKFGVRTLFLEGDTENETLRAQTEKIIAPLEEEIKNRTLTESEAADRAIKYSDLEYKKVDYRSDKFKLILTLEPKDPYELAYQLLRVNSLLGLEQIERDLKEGQCVIQIDGKFTNLSIAALFLNERSLKDKYGDDCPIFPQDVLIPCDITGTPDKKEHTGLLINDSGIERVKEYRSAMNKFWANFDYAPRNELAAVNIHTFFKGQTGENLAIAVDGIHHVLHSDDPNAIPSVQSRLRELGISSVTVMPYEATSAIDPKTRMPFITSKKE